VVKSWCSCGELRGKRGVMDDSFRAPKNTPAFSSLFFDDRCVVSHFRTRIGLGSLADGYLAGAFSCVRGCPNKGETQIPFGNDNQ
jgi:hypothetical protein